MKKYIFTFAILITLFSCSSEDDSNNNEDNRVPGPFSVTIIDTFIDGAIIEWTEAIDLDDDPVTYSIYVNDELISTGGTSLGYIFTGLEPETLYDGYILAEDGNGGESQAGFFFETQPETLIYNVEASDWIYDSFPEAGGIREVHAAGFKIPFYEGAISYQIEILEFSWVNTDGTMGDFTGVYSWTNESQNDPVYYNLDDTNEFGVYINGSSINTINPNYDEAIAFITSRQGLAQVIVTF